ncbi:MAG: hypothetical protein O3C10_13805, partial [Chloroflexi bacterium]|nr:hypothetical protein [Chloroflexota bacterium]
FKWLTGYYVVFAGIAPIVAHRIAPSDDDIYLIRGRYVVTGAERHRLRAAYIPRAVHQRESIGNFSRSLNNGYKARCKSNPRARGDGILPTFRHSHSLEQPR